MHHVRQGRIRHALHGRIARLDDIVLIRRVGAAAVTGPEMTRGQTDRSAGKDIARPGTGSRGDKLTGMPNSL